MGGDEVVAVVFAVDGCAFFDLVGSEVGLGDETAPCLFKVGDLFGDRALVEGVGVF